jgi:hypothetical protein
MILFENDHDPAMRYEGLARFAFDNCGKYGDPWGYCTQDKYANFVPTPKEEGKRALSTILSQLIMKYKDSPIFEILKELEENVWTASTQEDVRTIIDETIDLFREK